MAKWINNDAWNALLGKLKTADQIWVTSSGESSFSSLSAAKLGSKGFNAGTVSFPAGSEKNVTLPTVSGVSVDKTGQATHVALIRSASSEVLVITEVTPQQVVQGGSMDIGAITLRAEVL
jgi:hypothetical protein|nr:MAG TPA: hypothetical protein [Caudoviricetes sp.]